MQVSYRKAVFQRAWKSMLERYVEFEFHVDYEGDGTYHIRKSDDEFIHLEHGEEMNGLANEAVSNMDNLLDNAAIVFLSDYENYFAALLCPLDKDHQVIRGFFPNPNPTL
uniref:uncharacterized protein LOC120335332 n=1 Tax=Styela clava TaxID=7725 RepID=UPI001939370A|nr:uncharacterized protein LOC120335332 [Styela clava]